MYTRREILGKDRFIKWSQASVHYRNQGEKSGREVGAFLLTNGKVLIMPDYKNTSMESYIGEYGYKISYGTLTKGRETFRISGKMGGLPVFVMGHQGETYIGL